MFAEFECFGNWEIVYYERLSWNEIYYSGWYGDYFCEWLRRASCSFSLFNSIQLMNVTYFSTKFILVESDFFYKKTAFTGKVVILGQTFSKFTDMKIFLFIFFRNDEFGKLFIRDDCLY
jgi:hypothetical protein